MATAEKECKLSFSIPAFHTLGIDIFKSVIHLVNGYIEPASYKAFGPFIILLPAIRSSSNKRETSPTKKKQFTNRTPTITTKSQQIANKIPIERKQISNSSNNFPTNAAEKKQ